MDRLGRRRAFRPSPEQFEARELLASIIPILIGESRAAAAAIRAAAAGAAGGSGGAGGGASSGGGAMTLADLGTPTPHELAREAFRATFSGPYLVGPPRFTNQAKQILIVGVGTSTAFLHGNVQIGLFTPADPASGTVSGAASLQDRNATNSGNVLGLDLAGSPQDVDARGRPIHLTWTVNGNGGGAFSGAIGQGTLDIRYRPGLQRHHGKGDGTALVLFQGRIFTSNVTNLLVHNLNTI